MLRRIRRTVADDERATKRRRTADAGGRIDSSRFVVTKPLSTTGSRPNRSGGTRLCGGYHPLLPNPRITTAVSISKSASRSPLPSHLTSYPQSVRTHERNSSRREIHQLAPPISHSNAAKTGNEGNLDKTGWEEAATRARQLLVSDLRLLYLKLESGFEYDVPPSSVPPTSVVSHCIQQVESDRIGGKHRVYDPQSSSASGAHQVLDLVWRTLKENEKLDNGSDSEEGRRIRESVERVLMTIGREGRGDCRGDSSRAPELEELNEFVKERLITELEEVFGANSADFRSEIEKCFVPQTSLLPASCLVAANWPPKSKKISKFLTGAPNWTSELLNRKFNSTGSFPIFDIMNFVLDRRGGGSPNLSKAFAPHGHSSHERGGLLASELLKGANQFLLEKRVLNDGVTVVCGSEPRKLLDKMLIALAGEKVIKVYRYQKSSKVLDLDVMINFSIVSSENGTHIVFETCHPSFGISAAIGHDDDSPEDRAKRLALDLVLDFVYLLDNNELNHHTRAGIFWNRRG